MYFGSLSEEFLLLVLDNKTGKLRENMTPHLSIGLIGGILLELVLNGRITIHNNHIILIDETPVEDKLLNEALSLIIAEDEKLPVLFWIRKLRYHYSKLETELLDRLVEKGILRKSVQKRFWLFTDNRYHFIRPEIKEIIKQNIYQIVVINEESDHHTLAKLSLIYATNCTTEIFTEDELEEYIHDIRNLVAGDEIGQSVATAINNIIDALMRTLIISSSYAY
ncbi:MAG: GOLPH3/VPS74 family protein [Candidatus Kariarchaeaceae archaeon]|jgi:hypothetical protein